MIGDALHLIKAYWNELWEYWTPVIMISIGIIVFVLEAFVGMKAEYGRYNKKKSGLPAPIAWLIQECPAFFVPLFLIFYNGVKFFDSSNSINTNLVLLMLFMMHYFNRSFIYTTRIRSKNVVNYLENFLAFVFCFVNGYQIGHYHSRILKSDFFEWNFMLGVAIFFTGFYINIDSDNRLIKLRKESNGTGYKIPKGGMFEYVSAANYFGECLEWFGFAIASWSLPGLAFAWFTLANTGPRGYHHHLFYKEKFGSDYPKNRKALIPFLI
ncbi:3-oxo-5-alpha-steroid 4-dehydrogenase 2 [Brachionus plicatilis]|uniref:3-oxo-5alpha-steroid 4-dehydrogenase (NADP(+)) n=1 Tax=Brachionus plicatilis TaxID=10195 RepID=A0A3M7SEA4_BRAPC|nr:3-oxo-5-alpha-steroid 4-dehydrogenase 2 [Brachionus plicatilis]